MVHIGGDNVRESVRQRVRRIQEEEAAAKDAALVSRPRSRSPSPSGRSFNSTTAATPFQLSPRNSRRASNRASNAAANAITASRTSAVANANRTRAVANANRANVAAAENAQEKAASVAATEQAAAGARAAANRANAAAAAAKKAQNETAAKVQQEAAENAKMDAEAAAQTAENAAARVTAEAAATSMVVRAPKIPSSSTRPLVNNIARASRAAAESQAAANRIAAEANRTRAIANRTRAIAEAEAEAKAATANRIIAQAKANRVRAEAAAKDKANRDSARAAANSVRAAANSKRLRNYKKSIDAAVNYRDAHIEAKHQHNNSKVLMTLVKDVKMQNNFKVEIKGEYFGKNWETRYFILYPDKLVYKKFQTSNDPLDTIMLQDIISVERDSDTIFKILRRHKDENSELDLEFRLKADSKTLTDMWLNGIQKTIEPFKSVKEGILELDDPSSIFGFTKKRNFRLYSNRLEYNDPKEPNKPTKIIMLKDITVNYFQNIDPYAKPTTTFYLTVAESTQNKGREDYELKASSKDEAQAWVNAIKQQKMKASGGRRKTHKQCNHKQRTHQKTQRKRK